MIATVQQILERTLDQLASLATTYVPPLLAALVIFGMSFALAVLVRYILLKATRAAGFELFLAQSGLSSMLARSGRVRAARLISGTAYVVILLTGFLMALSALNTALTSRMVETIVFLLPKLVTAGVILLAGGWLAQYMARGVLVWSCNEGLPRPRRIAAAVRIVVMFVAAVVAADHLDFARSVFLSAFVVILAGAVLAGGIAGGLTIHEALKRHLDRAPTADEAEKSLWNHL